MEALAALAAEHSAVLAVLAELDRASAAAAQGMPIAAGIFADIQEFFEVFVDRCHHGKEETELFPRLRQGSAGTLVQRLQDEHAEGRALVASYAEAVHAYVPGQADSGARLERAANACSDLLREHIVTETAELFPAAETSLAEDDESLVDAFERLELERIGPTTHERLHAMIYVLPDRIDHSMERAARTPH